MAAFRLAAESGVKWIEFDVHLTQDGMPIIIHDDTLDRTTNRKGNVADLSWVDIQQLDAGSWFDAKFSGERVPHMKEVLNLALERKLRPMIEIKPSPGRTQATTMVTLIEAAQIWPHTLPPPMILSFDREALGIASTLQPHWPRGISFEVWQDDWREQAAKVGAEALVMDSDFLTHERMINLQHGGLPVLVYTVNEADRAKQLLDQGARALFTDQPKELSSALK